MFLKNGVTNHNENESIEVITHDNNTTKSTPETQPYPQPYPQPEPDPPVEIESKSPEVQLINKTNLNPSDTTTQHTISYTTVINDTETKEDIKDIKHKDSNSTPTPISSNSTPTPISSNNKNDIVIAAALKLEL